MGLGSASDSRNRTEANRWGLVRSRPETLLILWSERFVNGSRN
jgi:hypothetical protein